MNIPNNYRMKYDTYFCNKQNKRQEQNMQSPIKHNNSPNFGGGTGGLVNLIIADYITEGAIFGRPSSPQKPKNKKEYKPRHVYASEMDLKLLDEKLRYTDIKIDGNKVTIKDNYSVHENEQTADIPQEFFEGCNTDKDKEYLVKRWLVESKYDYNFEHIPYELLKAADDTCFYNVSNHRIYMDYDTKLREEGIKIGKLEKADDDSKNNIINLEIDGTKYKFKTSANKTDIILGAASYLGAPFDNYPFAEIIKNIKDTKCGKFVKEKNYEIFIPKLYVGKPTFKDKALINYGTAHEYEYNNWSAKNIIAQEVGINIDTSDIKQIDYINDYSAKKNHAYAYYDNINDDQYLYLINEQKLLKQDTGGNIYQKVIENYKDNAWEKVEK